LIGDAGRVSGRAPAADRLSELRGGVAGLVEAVLEGRGTVSVEERRAAFSGHPDDNAVSDYVELVRSQAYRVTAEEIERLRGAGLDDDAIFELTVAAGLGVGVERLEAGLSLLGQER
jgi:alkylhydroperoxidase family enzyme